MSAGNYGYVIKHMILLELIDLMTLKSRTEFNYTDNYIEVNNFISSDSRHMQASGMIFSNNISKHIDII